MSKPFTLWISALAFALALSQSCTSDEPHPKRDGAQYRLTGLAQAGDTKMAAPTPTEDSTHVPQIDLEAPRDFQTATFALG